MLKHGGGSVLLLIIAITGCSEQEPYDVQTQHHTSIDVSPASLLTSSAFIDAQDPIEADGGSIQTDLGYDIVVNSASSLNRRWIVVPQVDLPLTFDGIPGIATHFSDRDRFEYTAKVNMSASQSVTAFQVRFIIYDIFNEHMTTLSATEVLDMPTGGSQTFNWAWSSRENDVEIYFMSIAFISRVRMANGQVHEFNADMITDVIQRAVPEANEDDIHIPSERGGGDPVI